MRIYDISQEVFGCVVFPGDPAPVREQVSQIGEGAICNLTAFSMCAHNGTHVDAPYHFIEGGRKVDELSLEALVGKCYVADHRGPISGEDALEMVQKARAQEREAAKRMLIRGEAVMTLEAARVFVESGVLLLGNESQTFGGEGDIVPIHQLLLGADIVLLEGIRLTEVSEGVYLLFAAPINLGQADGAPCRAVLAEDIFPS